MNNTDISKLDKYDEVDVDLFKISYLLWKGKILLLSLIILGTFASYGLYKFQEFQKVVYVDLVPNTESMPFLSKLDDFGIKSQNIEEGTVKNILKDVLFKSYGSNQLISKVMNSQIYLNNEIINSLNLSFNSIEKTIINTLNQLNIDPIRNRILLKVLPLKV